MNERINDASSDFEQPKTQITRQTDSSKGAFVRPKARSIGLNAVVIKESAHLGPQAYNADGAGMRAMQSQNQAFVWGADRPPGALEGSASKKPPQSIYLLWFFKHGEFWMKVINVNWEAMQDTIQSERAELKSKMYRRTIQQNFRDLVKEINEKKGDKIKKLSVLTYPSDDFTGGSAKKVTTEEASPKDINP